MPFVHMSRETQTSFSAPQASWRFDPKQEPLLNTSWHLIKFVLCDTFVAPVSIHSASKLVSVMAMDHNGDGLR